MSQVYATNEDMSMDDQKQVQDTIGKMREMSEANLEFAALLESGEIKTKHLSQDNVRQMIARYRYWSECLLVAAWLLENDGTGAAQVQDD